MKKDIHPKWYPKAKVLVNGEEVMTVGSTQPELHVEIWSGTHPFFTGKQKLVDTARRVEKFKERAEKQKDAAATRKGKKVKRTEKKTAKAKKSEQ